MVWFLEASLSSLNMVTCLKLSTQGFYTKNYVLAELAGAMKD